MFEYWLTSLPKTIIVGAALLLGLIMIYILYPPYSKCDAQKEIFKEHHINYIFLDPKRPLIKTTQFKKDSENCRVGYSPGACLDFFDGIRKVLRELEGLTHDCSQTIANLPEVRTFIWEAQEMILRLAWGGTPPESSYVRMRWLDSVHMNVFCRLKEFSEETYGKTNWSNFRDKQMEAFPGAEKLDRKTVWQRSILSINCAQYR